MIVYGDRERSERTASAFTRLERLVSALEETHGPQLRQAGAEARAGDCRL